MMLPLAVTVMVAGLVLCEVSHHRGLLTVAGLAAIAVGMACLLAHTLRPEPSPPT